MQINMDRSQPASVSFSNDDWTASPVAGVDRIRFERDGAESGLATSVVRYAEGSAFHEHAHPGGEELFILDGVFSDEKGDYPAGSYIRNPDPSPHSPSSRDGCILFVRLCQMHDDQSEQITVHANDLEWQETEKGFSIKTLYRDKHETIELGKHKADSEFTLEGEELLVVSGEIYMDGNLFPAYSWIRSPQKQKLLVHGGHSATVLIKKGHLV